MLKILALRHQVGAFPQQLLQSLLSNARFGRGTRFSRVFGTSP